jgi:division protein CdvB (Snf7/Vps24/ESCRT-III family)
LLTESTVESMFRKLMNEPNRTEKTFDKAEELIEEELRPESPLRHRLSTELIELRTLASKG